MDTLYLRKKGHIVVEYVHSQNKVVRKTGPAMSGLAQVGAMALGYIHLNHPHFNSYSSAQDTHSSLPMSILTKL